MAVRIADARSAGHWAAAFDRLPAIPHHPFSCPAGTPAAAHLQAPFTYRHRPPAVLGTDPGGGLSRIEGGRRVETRWLTELLAAEPPPWRVAGGGADPGAH